MPVFAVSLKHPNGASDVKKVTATDRNAAHESAQSDYPQSKISAIEKQGGGQGGSAERGRSPHGGPGAGARQPAGGPATPGIARVLYAIGILTGAFAGVLLLITLSTIGDLPRVASGLQVINALLAPVATFCVGALIYGAGKVVDQLAAIESHLNPASKTSR